MSLFLPGTLLPVDDKHPNVFFLGVSFEDRLCQIIRPHRRPRVEAVNENDKMGDVSPFLKISSQKSKLWFNVLDAFWHSVILLKIHYILLNVVQLCICTACVSFSSEKREGV